MVSLPMSQTNLCVALNSHPIGERLPVVVSAPTLCGVDVVDGGCGLLR